MNRWIYPENNHKKQHPLLELEQTIKKYGLVVVDNITQMPFYGKPYNCNYVVYSLCHRGWVLAEYDSHEVEFRPHEICIIMPNHTITAHESSPDYLATLIVVCPETFNEMQRHSIYRHQASFKKLPAFPLADNQYASIVELFSLVRTVSRLNTTQKPVMLANLIDTLNTLLSIYRFPDDTDRIKEIPPGEQLFDRYYNLIVANHATTREVGFYAKQFNLTAKYFSTLIKRETGIAAGDWISNYIVIQAKTLLRNAPELNIQQIGLKLGFSDQAAFSRYFKTNTGQSPREYREKWI